jgi:hypothetical protein
VQAQEQRGNGCGLARLALSNSSPFFQSTRRVPRKTRSGRSELIAMEMVRSAVLQELWNQKLTLQMEA